jgi:hypothetical protein
MMTPNVTEEETMVKGYNEYDGRETDDEHGSQNKSTILLLSLLLL